MLTFLTMLIQKVVGATFVGALIGIIWIIYLLLFLIVKANRNLKRIKTAFITGVIVTFICDIVWFFKFFDNFEYINPGLSGAMWFCLLPLLMFIIVMFLSFINTSSYEYELKKREKDEAKRLKKEKRRKKFESETKE